MDTEQTPIKQNSSRLKIYFALLAVAVICAGLAIKFLQPSTKSIAAKTEVVVVLPLSGKGASHGEYVREGLQMYAKDHPDSRLHVTIVDSESDPKKAVSGFQQQLLLQKPAAAISVLTHLLQFGSCFTRKLIKNRRFFVHTHGAFSKCSAKFWIRSAVLYCIRGAIGLLQ